MNIKLNIILILSVIILNPAFSQDTIRYDKKINYKSEDYPIRGKHFVSILDYAREDILFNENKVRVEYCYYYDKERNCFGNTYEKLNDSIILVNDSKWNFRKRSDNDFLVWKKDNILIEYGQAQSIIPFNPKGIFYTTNRQTRDTLWQEDYDFYQENHPNSNPSFCYYYTKINEKIYEYDEVSLPPTNLDFTSLDKVNVYPYHCISQPLTDISLMTCIVTKEGRIINIEQALGTMDLNCPNTIKEIIREIASWGKILPAKKNGNSVHTRWFITIDNQNRQILHPMIADTPNNRKKVIKIKKKKAPCQQTSTH